MKLYVQYLAVIVFRFADVFCHLTGSILPLLGHYERRKIVFHWWYYTDLYSRR